MPLVRICAGRGQPESLSEIENLFVAGGRHRRFGRWDEDAGAERKPRGDRWWLQKPAFTPLGLLDPRLDIFGWGFGNRWRCSLSRLWVPQISFHSQETRSKPHIRKRRMPRTSLICPKPGSMIAFPNPYFSLPASVART